MIPRYLSICIGTILFRISWAQNDTTCIFNGQSFLSGENLGDAFLNRCGTSSDWPCFCNPTLEWGAECPYCTFSSGDGNLYCASDGDNVTFRDGSISRECSCEIPDDPTLEPVRKCIVAPAALGCNWFDEEGNVVFVEDGKSFGDSGGGACGPASEFPSFCYVPSGSVGADDFLIDYPYCVFDDAESGEVLCTQDGETVEYVDREGDNLRCTCSYTKEDGPNPECEKSASGSPGSPTNAPKTSPAPAASPKSKPSSSWVLCPWLATRVVLLILPVAVGIAW